MTPPLRVVVVGAGIGGLSAAIALRDVGAEVVVLERTERILPMGAGICMWPNGAQALHALGIADALAGTSPTVRRIDYRTAAGDLVRELSVDRLTEQVGQRPFPLARADLHAALLSRLPEETIRLGAACQHVEQDERSARVVLADGQEFEADLVVGADGIHSAVRPSVVDGGGTLRYHYTTWVGLVPSALGCTPDDVFTFHVQDSQRVGLLHVGLGRLYFFCDAVPDGPVDAEGARAELRGRFDGWCPAVRTLVDAVDDAATHSLPVHDLDPLPTFVRGRVVLLGDAAHATTPTLGQGGALAMEDSLVLARCLAGEPDVAAALDRYDTERRPRTRAVMLESRARSAATLGIDDTQSRAWRERLARSGSQDFMDQLVEIERTGPLSTRSATTGGGAPWTTA